MEYNLKEMYKLCVLEKNAIYARILKKTCPFD